MRKFHLITIVAVVAGSSVLAGCKKDEVIQGLDAIARFPKVCPVDVRAVLTPERSVEYTPIVVNKGILTSNLDFEVHIIGSVEGQSGYTDNLFVVPSSVSIVGTGGNPSSSAGPEVALSPPNGAPALKFAPPLDRKVTIQVRIDDSKKAFLGANADCQRRSFTFIGVTRI